MPLTPEHIPGPGLSRFGRWLRFFAGLLTVLLVYGFFASGYALPGVFGEVFRHNQRNNIDATPLFYTEVENMSELEKDLLKMRAEASEKYLNDKKVNLDSPGHNRNINGGFDQANSTEIK